MPETKPVSNPVVESYREYARDQGINERRDDQTLTRELGDALRQRGRQDVEKAHPAFREEYLRERRKDAPGLISEGVTGLKRGVQSGGAALGGFVEMGARQAGKDELADRAAAFRERRQEAISELPGRAVEDIRDIRTPMDFLRFASGIGGEQIPITGAIMAGGVLGGLAGSAATPAGTVAGGATGAVAVNLAVRAALREGLRAGATRTATRAAATQAAKNQAIRNLAVRGGQLAGAAAPATGSYVGDIYGTSVDAGAEHGDAARAALLYGTPAALVSIIYPARVTAMLMNGTAREVGKQQARSVWVQRARNAMREAGLGVVLEGSAEAMAETLVVLGERSAIPDYQITQEQFKTRILNAAAAGALIGGGLGGIGGAARRVPTTQRTDQGGQQPDPATDPSTDSAPDPAMTAEEVVDQFIEIGADPAAAPVLAETGRQVAAQLQDRANQGVKLTADQQAYVNWWQENMEAVEQAAQDPENLARLQTVLRADETIDQQNARLEGRQPQMFETPLVEPGRATDPFALPEAEAQVDPFFVEPASPVDPSQVTAGSTIDGRRETVRFGEVDADTRDALNDALSFDPESDPFARPEAPAEGSPTTQAVASTEDADAVAAAALLQRDTNVPEQMTQLESIALAVESFTELDAEGFFNIFPANREKNGSGFEVSETHEARIKENEARYFDDSGFWFPVDNQTTKNAIYDEAPSGATNNNTSIVVDASENGVTGLFISIRDLDTANGDFKKALQTKLDSVRSAAAAAAATDADAVAAAAAPIPAAEPQNDANARRNKVYESLLKKGKLVGDGLYELTEKQVTPVIRRSLISDRDRKSGFPGRPVETLQFQLRPKADVTGNPYDRGYILSDRRDRVKEREAAAEASATPAPQRDPSAAPETPASAVASDGITPEADTTVQAQPSPTPAQTAAQPAATEVTQRQIRPLLTDFKPDGTITPVILRTELLPIPKDVSTIAEGSKVEGQTASRTQNFIAIEMADGTFETRGVFPSENGVLIHNKISQTTTQDIADAVGSNKAEVSKVLNLFRDKGEIRGKKDDVRQRSQQIIDAAREMNYEEGAKHIRLNSFLSEKGVKAVGFFQTDGPPPQMIQKFANRNEFDAAFEETASISRAQKGGLADFVGADKERATIGQVAELAGVSVEDASSVFKGRAVDPQLSSAVRQAAEELGYRESRVVPIKEQGESGPGIDISSQAVGESAPLVGSLYNTLQAMDVVDTLISNLGKIPGVIAMGRMDPEAIQKKLLSEVLKVLPPSAQRAWRDEGIPANMLPQVQQMRQQMIEGLYQDLSQMAAKGIFQRKGQPDQHRTSNAFLQQRFADISAILARLGISLQIAQPDANASDPFWHGEGGRYIISNRTVQLAVSDIVNPTSRNLLDLLHEGAHDLFQNEPPWIRSILHDMIARMDKNDLAFYGEALADPRARIEDPAGLGRRVVTEEMMVEHLTFQGVDRDTARSLVRQLIDAVKEILLKAALRFQTAYVGSEAVSDFLAREYIETRWQRMLDGKPIYNSENWLGRLGGRKLTYGEAAHFFTLTDPDGFTQMLDPATGQIETKAVLNDSPAAMAHNRNAIIAAALADAIHARDAQMEVGEILLRREMEDAGLTVTPQQDRAYMDAIERGDTEAAQRMVDTAAKAAGYNEGPLLRGDRKPFTRLRPGGQESESQVAGHPYGIYLTNNERYAESYGTTRKFYAKAVKLIGPAAYRAFKEKYEISSMEATNRLANEGYDGVAFRPEMDAKMHRIGWTELVVFNSESIKSAESVTRDDNGNIIPLSERFNDQNPDIRYSQRGSRAAEVTENRKKELQRRLRQEAMISIAENNTVNQFVERAMIRAKEQDPSITRAELLRRLGLTHDPLVLAQMKSQNQDTYGDPVSAELQLSDLPFEARNQAEIQALRQMHEMETKLSVRIGDKTHSKTKAEASLSAKQNKFETLAKNADDIKKIEQQARAALRDQIAQLEKDVKAQAQGDHAAGMTSGALQMMLEMNEATEVSDNFMKLLKNLVTEGTPILSYVQQLQRFSRDVIDFDSHTAREIRQAVIAEVSRDPDNHPLRDLTKGTKGTPLLALLITFSKQEAHLAAVMELQQLDQMTRKAVVADLRRMLQDRTESGFEDMRRRARSMPRSTQNDTIVKFANLRREMKSLARKIEADTQSIESSTIGLKEATGVSAELEAQHGVGVETLLMHGAELTVPTKPDTTNEELEASMDGETKNPNYRTYRIAAGDTMTNGDKIRIVEKQKAFLRYREESTNPAAKDKYYWKVKREAESLGKVVMMDEVLPIQQGFMDSARQSLPAILRRSNLPAGRAAASMLERRQVIVKPNEASANSQGKAFEAAKNRFIKAAKIDKGFYRKAIYNKAAHWLNSEAITPQEGSLNALRAMLSDNPKARDALARPGAWDAFVILMRETQKNVARERKILEDNGLSIRDRTLGQRLNTITGKMEDYTRSVVDGGLMIFPRSLSETTRVVLQEMKNLGWWDTVTGLKGFTSRMTDNIDAARAQLQQMVTPSVLANYIQPLIIDNDTAMFLNRPVRPDGQRLKADPAYVSEAWNASNGDLMTFAEQLYAFYSDGATDPEGAVRYAGQIVEQIGQDFIAKIEGHAKDVQSDTGTKVSVDKISYSSLNARSDTHSPSQFFTYAEFGPMDNKYRTEQVASQAVFGRDFTELFDLFDQMESDLKQRKNELDTTREQLILETPSLATDQKGMDRALRNHFKGRFELMQGLDDALKIYNSNALKAQIHGIFKGANDITADRSVLQHVLGTIVGMLVNTPKTGAKNLISNNDVVRKWGVDDITLRAAADAWVETGRQVSATLLSLFGKNILAHNEKWMQVDTAVLGLDHATETKFRDNLTERHGQMSAWDDQGFAGKVKKALAFTSDAIIDSAINPLGAEQKAVAFRPLGPFMMSQIWSNRTTTKAVITAYELMAHEIAKFYRANPQAMNDPDYRVTAKDIGRTKVNQKSVFEKMSDDANQFGFTMEDIGRMAVLNPSHNRLPFDIATIQKLGLIAISHISMEANPTNRPVWSMTGEMGRASIPLVGWSLESFNTTTNMLRGADGKRNLQSVGVGLGGLMLAVLPISIAYSLLFDEYDRRLLGRQPNIRPLTSADPKELALGLIERINSMGTLGLGGELLVGTVNLKDSTGQRVLSVDERVVWLNTVGRIMQTIGTIIAQGGITNTTYASTWRSLFQGLGGAGAIQAMQMTNTILGHPPIPGLRQEGAVTQRINAQNWLRSQGRNMGMEIRQAGGFARPTPVTPHVTNMQLAALRGDADAFSRSYRRAVEEARKMPNVDMPEDHVKRSYQSRHPLRNVFRTSPSPAEYQRLIQGMPRIGREATKAAIDNYNRMGQRIGVTPYVGTVSRTTTANRRGGFDSGFTSGFSSGFDSALRDSFSSGF
jgi:hypothetical protein